MTAGRLSDLLPAAAQQLGVPGFPSGEQVPDLFAGTAAQHVIVLLVDGLGSRQLAQHASLTERLCAMTDLGDLSAPFPSSTCVSLTSLGTGLPPGMHGIVGTTLRLDDGSVLAPLSWGAEPNPVATQPEPTVLERAAAAGVQVTSVGPTAFRSSGLTRAALRGGGYAPADTAATRLLAIEQALSIAGMAGRRSLTYVYWPELDKAGHIHGVDSDAYRHAIADVDELVAGLMRFTCPEVALVVTADHGLVDVPDNRRIDLDARSQLRRGVHTILGEPRVRHVYAEPERSESVLRTWSAELGERAWVRSRAEVADLLGPVEEWYADRIGDVVAIALHDYALVSDRVDRVVSSLRGQHGGLTDDEVLIPLRVSWSAAQPGG